MGVLIAAFKGITELRAARIQRQQELRWKQANLGRELVDEMFDQEALACVALDTLDYAPFRRNFQIPGVPIEQGVEMKDIQRALDLSDVRTTPMDIYIRDSFEQVFYYFERLAYFVENELLTIEDIRFPLEYYAPMFLEEPIFRQFSDDVKYGKGLLLLTRISETYGKLQLSDQPSP